MILSNQYIFILGTTKFDNQYESASFTIAKHLAETNHVFYIENPFTWKDYFKHRGSKEFNTRKKYFSLKSDGILSTTQQNFKILITPPLLSINFLPESKFYRWLLKINERIIRKRIIKTINNKKIENYIFINSFNFHYPNVTEFLSPLLLVYHCVDPLILPFDKKHGLISEQILIKKSDLIICTSKQLYKEKKAINPNTHFIPNAADINHSSKALKESLPVDISIASIKKPIIGYIGHIERRLDFNLIKEVAERNQDKSFVFAGTYSSEFIPDWFFNKPNIYLTGRFAYNQLPSLLKGIDVAIIPFKKDKVSATIFPLKLFEYLGAGKPVVSTDFNPDLEEFTKDTVSFCKDSQEFSDAINKEINNDCQEKINMRVEIANENTWSKRVNEFSEIINSKIIKA